MFHSLKNYFNRLDDKFQRASHDRRVKVGLKFLLITCIMGWLVSCIYIAIIALVINPKFKEFIISEAAHFPDPITPRINFITVDYDNEQRRAKSMVIDLGQCAGIINLIHFVLTS